MTDHQLRVLLHTVDDSRELIVWAAEGGEGWREDELHAAWRAARAEANDALDAWRTRPGRDAYAVYVAAEDRADAAEEGLAAEQLARRVTRGLSHGPALPMR